MTGNHKSEIRNRRLSAGVCTLLLLLLIAAAATYGSALTWTAVPAACSYCVLHDGTAATYTGESTAEVSGEGTYCVVAIGPTGMWSAPSNLVYLTDCAGNAAIRLCKGKLLLSATGPAGSYVVQYSLDCVNWIDTGDVAVTTTGYLSATVPAVAGCYRFLRL
jgi:hypothetical protein